MSALYVDSIKDKSDTKTLATLSSSTVTLHSDVSFPAGMIINVQHFSVASETNTSSQTFVETALTDQITMTSASNKVIIIANVAGALKTASNYDVAYTIYRGTTNLANGGSNTIGDNDWMGFIKSGDSAEAGTNVNMTYVDTPGAGTHTYTVRYASSNSLYNAYFCVWGQTSQMILMEVTA